MSAQLMPEELPGPLMSAEMTIITTDIGRLTKRIELRADGTLAKTAAANPTGGSMKRASLPADASKAAGVLAVALPRLSPNRALILGRLRSDLPGQVTLTTKAQVPEGVKDVAARSGDFIQYAPGAPGFILLDFDQAQMPRTIADKMAKSGGFLAVLESDVIAPGLAAAARVYRSSTSAGLLRSDTGERLPDGGGLHAYCAVMDAADNPRALGALHDRLVLGGYGWAFITAPGKVLIRSLVDVAVAAPERLIFEGPPELVPPLTQDPEARRPIVRDGQWIDTRSCIPDLNIEEKARLAEIRARLIAEAEPAAAAARAAYADRAAAEAEVRGDDPRAARDAVERAVVGEVLAGPILLQFDNGMKITVSELIENRTLLRTLDGATLRDPHSPAAGRNKAVLYFAYVRDGLPAIYSQLHGGTILPLRHDAASLRAAVEAAGTTGSADPCQVVVDAIAGGIALLTEIETVETLGLAVRCAFPNGTKRENERRRAALARGVERVKAEREAVRARAAFQEEPVEMAAREAPPDFALTPAAWTTTGKNPIRICDPFRVIGSVADAKGLGHGLLLDWTDRPGHPHRWVMPLNLLAGEAAMLASALLDRGLIVEPGTPQRAALMQLFTGFAKLHRVALLLVRRTGRVEGLRAFALPGGEVLGPDAERVALAPEAMGRALTNAGTLEGWRVEVAGIAPGNPRLVLGLCVAWASMLTDLLGISGFIVNLTGPSSSGKTTIARASAAVWGSQLGTWRATANGLEAKFAAASGVGMTLDELSQAAPEDVATIAYALSGGIGKARADRAGGARDNATWSLCVLSTGEIDLVTALRRRRIRPDAGQGLRFLDVGVTGPTAAAGAFENLHGEPDGASFAARLDLGARAHAGVAGRAFVSRLFAQPDPPEDVARRAVEAAENALLARASKDLGAQAMRSLRSFAVIAAGGELATSLGLTGWPAGLALDAAMDGWAAWMDRREAGNADAEGMAAIRRVKEAIEMQPDRFAPLDDGSADLPAGKSASYFLDEEPDDEVRNGGQRRGYGPSWGHVVEGKSGIREYWLTDGAWTEIHRGYDERAALRALDAAKLLRRETSHLKPKVKIPDLRDRVRRIIVRGEILEHGD